MRVASVGTRNNVSQGCLGGFNDQKRGPIIHLPYFAQLIYLRMHDRKFVEQCLGILEVGGVELDRGRLGPASGTRPRAARH